MVLAAALQDHRLRMANKKTVDFYLVIVLGFSLFVNVGLAMKVHKLILLTTPVPLQQLTVGSRVESLDALDVSGKAKHLIFGSGDKLVVLYAFTPTCGWCAKNLSNIKEIYRLKHPEFEFIGVSLSPNGVPEYLSRSGFPLEVVKDPSAASREKFHFNGTPETIVVDSSGTVKQVWLGAYTSDACRKIEQFFQMPKGGLSAAS